MITAFHCTKRRLNHCATSILKFITRTYIRPDISPGDEFQYTSGTMIETSLGTMKGSYHMIDDEDNYFDAIIPEFVLSIPRIIH